MTILTTLGVVAGLGLATVAAVMVATTPVRAYAGGGASARSGHIHTASAHRPAPSSTGHGRII